MMLLRNVLTILAVLGLNTALFAQKKPERRFSEKEDRCASMNFMPPDVALSDQVPATYNMSGRINLDRGYDVFLDASFIYWNVGQDYMDIGRTAVIHTDGSTIRPAAEASVPTHPFKYQPGFKVGAGIGTNFDNWQFEAEYTYLHEASTYSTGSSANTFGASDQVIMFNDWYANLSVNDSAARMTSKWKMNLDMVDALLSRPFYQGQRVNVTPYVGLRSLWIRQLFKITAPLVTDTAAPPAISNNRSRGWGIGPNFRADMNWLLGMGFRIEANAGVSLLYMRYTKVSHEESFPPTVTASTPLNGHSPTRGYLRPINELGMGFGWGTYAYSKRFHFDFSARYDFAIFWSQNMMRYNSALLADNVVGYAAPIGDLYLHGMTLTARFDF